MALEQRKKQKNENPEKSKAGNLGIKVKSGGNRSPGYIQSTGGMNTAVLSTGGEKVKN